MSRVALGFRVHSGWAAAVAIVGPARSPAIVDRRRLDLRDPALPLQIYHAARPLDAGEAAELVRRAAEATWLVAERSLSGLISELERTGNRVGSAGIVLGGSWPAPVGVEGLSHAGAHAAEGQLYRQTLIDACEARALPVTGVAERALYARAAKALRLPIEEVQRSLVELGRRLGPPWRRDQKEAALAAWLALAECPD